MSVLQRLPMLQENLYYLQPFLTTEVFGRQEKGAKGLEKAL